MRFLSILPSLLLALPLMAQPNHTVALSWTASTDTGGTVTVYRAPTACSSNPSNFTAIKTGVVAAGPYSDTGVEIGNYCYRITAVVNGAESLPSNTANITVLPQSPTALVGAITQ